MSSSKNRSMLSNATGCPDCSINLDLGVFNVLNPELLFDHSRHTSFKQVQYNEHVLLQHSDIIECQVSSCSGNGECKELRGGGTLCLSEPGWTSSDCSVNIDDCDPNPCVYSNSCTDQLQGYTCDCQEGFQGHQCHEGKMY